MYESRNFLAATAFLSLLMVVPALARGDLERGKRLFKEECAICHAVKAGVNKIGPSLAGVVGRPAGATDFTRYTGLKHAKFVWNEEKLAGFLADPAGFLGHETTMYSKMSAAEDRADVIEYLETLE